jgi:hypothetical protein
VNPKGQEIEPERIRRGKPKLPERRVKGSVHLEDPMPLNVLLDQSKDSELRNSVIYKRELSGCQILFARAKIPDQSLSDR